MEICINFRSVSVIVVFSVLQTSKTRLCFFLLVSQCRSTTGPGCGTMCAIRIRATKTKTAHAFRCVTFWPLVYCNQALECCGMHLGGQKSDIIQMKCRNGLNGTAFNQLTEFYFRTDLVFWIWIKFMFVIDVNARHMLRRLCVCVFVFLLLPFIGFISSSIHCTNSKFLIRLNNNINNHRAQDNDWPRLKRSYWLFIQITNLLLQNVEDSIPPTLLLLGIMSLHSWKHYTNIWVGIYLALRIKSY